MTKGVLGVAFAIAVVMFACGPSGKETDCRNGIDDDKNGATDCLDPACAADLACSGTDASVVTNFCATQGDCVDAGWNLDRPLRACLGSRCEGQGTAVAVRVEASTQALLGTSAPIRTMSTKFVRKIALDNSTVTCAAIRAATPSKADTDTEQLEKSGKFNLLAYDNIRVESLSGGQTVTNPLVYTSTSSAEWIFYGELWSGFPTSGTRQPTGQRLAYVCVESGAAVAPITTSNNCETGAGGTCRTIQVTMVKEP